MQRTLTRQLIYDNCVEIDCYCSGSRNKTCLEARFQCSLQLNLFSHFSDV